MAAGSKDLIVPLTEREYEVLRLIATGVSNRDMASILFIAESTVKAHVEHIIGKLGVSDRVQAAVWAARHGLAPETEQLAKKIVPNRRIKLGSNEPSFFIHYNTPFCGFMLCGYPL